MFELNKVYSYLYILNIIVDMDEDFEETEHGDNVIGCDLLSFVAYTNSQETISFILTEATGNEFYYECVYCDAPYKIEPTTPHVTFTKRLEQFDEDIKKTITALIEKNGMGSLHSNRTVLFIQDESMGVGLDGGRDLTEVHSDGLIDSSGYEYNYSSLDAEELAFVVDYLIAVSETPSNHVRFIYKYDSSDGQWEMKVHYNGVVTIKLGDDTREYTIKDKIYSIEIEDEYVTLNIDRDKHYQFKFEENSFLEGDVFDSNGHIETIADYKMNEDLTQF